MLVVLGICAFLAGFVDAVVGGGGLIQLPALLIFLPPDKAAVIPSVLGTNKLSSICGTSIALVQYARKIPFHWPTLAPATCAAFFCSYLGARSVAALDPALLRPLILGLLIGVAIYTFTQKNFGAIQRPPLPAQLQFWAGLGTGALIGFYDGFFGPGTGSFLIFAFVGLFGLDFLTAAANAKMVNFATNLAALLYFASTGSIYWEYALVMAVCNVAGAALGARLAILKGNLFVRRLFLFIIALLILRLGWEMLRPFFTAAEVPL